MTQYAVTHAKVESLNMAFSLQIPASIKPGYLMIPRLPCLQLVINSKTHANCISTLPFVNCIISMICCITILNDKGS